MTTTTHASHTRHTIPQRPEDVLLLLVGPNTHGGMNSYELTTAAHQLRVLGYQVIHAADLQVGAKTLPIADGVARTEHWHEWHDSSLLVDAAEALNMPVLGVDAWARATGPDAQAWFAELFDGAKL